MPAFGSNSKANLYTAHVELQRLFEEVVKGYDCTVICGYRSKEDQDKAVAQGLSKTPYPQSKHNRKPSVAVDVAPYPINWKDEKRFYHFAGYVMGVAERLGIPVRWGGDWDSDNDLNDQTFMDLVHFELRGV